MNSTLQKIMVTLEVLGALSLLWVAASWMDIIMHNMSTCQYAWWNLFTLLF